MIGDTAMTENTVRIDDRRFQLAEIPSQLCFRFEDDKFPDWSWTEDDDDELFVGEWGEFGPIDVDGHEHASLVILAERVWDDGYTETVNSLGGVVVYAEDPTIVASGIIEASPWPLEAMFGWLERYEEGTGRHYLATEALELAAEAGVKYHDCPYGCPTVPLDARDLEHHMGWHRAERAREGRSGFGGCGCSPHFSA